MTAITEHYAYVVFKHLSAGETGVIDLIQRTGYHRGTVYKALRMLVDEGFIVRIPGGMGKKTRWRTTEKGISHYNTIQLSDLSDMSVPVSAIEDVYMYKDVERLSTFRSPTSEE